MKRLLPVAFVALATLLGPAPLSADGPTLAGMRTVIDARFPGVRWVDAPTLDRWLRSPEPPVLLDARRADEFAVSHLRGALRIDPDHPDWGSVGDISGRRVVVYCSVGYRSADIAKQLQEHGHPAVFNLEEGLFGWANSGRPLHRNGRRARQVHPYDRLWGLMLRQELRAPLPSL